MKKFLISVLLVLLIVLTYFLMMKEVPMGKWKSKSIDDIKSLNSRLDEQINTAKQIKNQEYPQSVSTLEDSIKELEVAKEKYENKLKYISENIELGVVEIKEYKIERLWITLQQYAQEENVELKLDVLETSASNTYDLDITITGDYIGITDFIYDIEKDDTLGFKILNFKLEPYSTTTKTTTTSSSSKITDRDVKDEADISKYTNNNTSSTQTTTTVNVSILKATFKIEDVGIEFN